MATGQTPQFRETGNIFYKDNIGRGCVFSLNGSVARSDSETIR